MAREGLIAYRVSLIAGERPSRGPFLSGLSPPSFRHSAFTAASALSASLREIFPLPSRLFVSRSVR